MGRKKKCECGVCALCKNRVRQATYRAKNPEKAKAAVDASRAKNYAEYRARDNEAHRVYREENREENNSRQREWQKDSRNRFRAVINHYKDKPCNICGIKYPPVAMDLHHRNPKDKLFNFGNFHKVSALPGMTRMETLEAELSKCDVLCSNCHRIHHHD